VTSRCAESQVDGGGRKEKDPPSNDVQVEVVPLGEGGSLPAESEQFRLDGLVDRGAFQNVAILGAAIVVGLQHEGDGAKHTESDLRGARWPPGCVELDERYLAPPSFRH